MWRSFSIALFLFVLANTANALPIENLSKSFSSHSVTLQLEKSNLQDSTDHTVLAEDSEPEDSFSSPRIYQACASTFSNEVQTTPNYFLVIEFLKPKLSASVFKNIANPPLQLNWFEQLSHKSNSNRLSGWKDSNTLYASRVNYHH